MTYTIKKMVRRSQRLSFMNTGTTAEPVWSRMTGFTSVKDSKNPKEYTRQYVDMDMESADVVGYSNSVDYSFDRYTNTPVHERIAEITDDELMGTDAHVEIVTVDLFTEGKFVARKRTYAVIPNGSGDGTDALIYSGSFKAVTEIEKGTATTTDKWLTCVFTPDNVSES